MDLAFPRTIKRKQYSAVAPAGMYDEYWEEWEYEEEGPSGTTSSESTAENTPSDSAAETTPSDSTQTEESAGPGDLRTESAGPGPGRREESGDPGPGRREVRVPAWSAAERTEEHDGAEDWERHESFNNDVGTQVRYTMLLKSRT